MLVASHILMRLPPFLLLAVLIAGCAHVRPGTNSAANVSSATIASAPAEQEVERPENPPQPHAASVVASLARSEVAESKEPLPTENLFSREYGRLLLQDTREVLTAPFHWDTQDWLKFSLISASVAGLTYADKTITDF